MSDEIESFEDCCVVCVNESKSKSSKKNKEKEKVCEWGKCWVVKSNWKFHSQLGWTLLTHTLVNPGLVTVALVAVMFLNDAVEDVQAFEWAEKIQAGLIGRMTVRVARVALVDVLANTRVGITEEARITVVKW